MISRRLTSERNHYQALRDQGMLDALGLKVRAEHFGDDFFDKELHADLTVTRKGYVFLAAVRIRSQGYRRYAQFTQTGVEAGGRLGEAVTGHARLLVYGWCSTCQRGCACLRPVITEAYLADLEKIRQLPPSDRRTGGGHDKRQELWAWDISLAEDRGWVLEHAFASEASAQGSGESREPSGWSSGRSTSASSRTMIQPARPSWNIAFQGLKTLMT